MPKSNRNLKRKKVLITCGPTWTAIDQVRVISNISSGSLGLQLAQAFVKAGAQVTLLQGATTDKTVVNKARVVPFRYFKELSSLLTKELKKNYNYVFHAAAVSDYEVKSEFKSKIRSGQREVTLKLRPTTKIINQIKRKSPRSCLIGFKLETVKKQADLLKQAAKLMNDAKCDLVVANNSTAKSYRAYIVNSNNQVLAQSRSRKSVIRNLLKILREQPS